MRKKFFDKRFLVLALLTAVGCANLHSVMIGERRMASSGSHEFDVKVNETGFNIKEATDIVRAVGGKNSGAGKAAKTVNTVYELLSFGPQTGNPVLNAEYADTIGQQASASCSPSKTVGVVSIRETMKYPVISGEIVKIEGLCQ